MQKCDCGLKKSLPRILLGISRFWNKILQKLIENQSESKIKSKVKIHWQTYQFPFVIDT